MESLFWGERDLMDLPAFYARRVSEYIGGLVAAKETYKFQDADSLSLMHTHTYLHIWRWSRPHG